MNGLRSFFRNETASISFGKPAVLEHLIINHVAGPHILAQLREAMHNLPKPMVPPKGALFYQAAIAGNGNIWVQPCVSSHGNCDPQRGYPIPYFVELQLDDGGRVVAVSNLNG